MKHLSNLFRKPRSAPAVAKGPQAPLRVILFIGHHKVGSTSLQDYLSRNAVALARVGILYPYVDFEGMAYLAAGAMGSPAFRNETLPRNIRVPHNALAFRIMAEHKCGTVPPWHRMLPALAQMEHAIRQQIHFFSPHTVILAAEVFANFGALSEDLIRRLHALFPGADFTIMVTLRRIDDYLASWHGQRFKFGHQIAPLRDDGLDGYMTGIHFDYRLMIEGWLKVFPEARMIMRTYDEVRANGGSVGDFLAQTGIVVPEGMVPEWRENASFHRGLYEIIRRANIHLPAGRAAALRAQLMEATPALDLPPSGRIELFGAQNRTRLVEAFAPIDRFLGQVVGRDGFFADLGQGLEVSDIPEMEVYRPTLRQVRDLPGFGDDADIRAFLEALETETGKA